MAAKKRKYFGCHVSVSGGLVNGARNASTLQVNTIQIHATPPQRWNSKPAAKGVEDEFNAARSEAGIERLFFHAIYLINLANPDPQQFHLSKLSLVHSLELLSRMQGDGLIFHVGSAKDHNDEKSAFEQAAKGIDWILERTPSDAKLLLEVAAGSGAIIGDRMEELAAIYEMVEAKDRVGFALDTQHMWASGYDLRSRLDEVVAEVDSVLNLKKVWAIHLNDSKTELGSRKDRHENIGDGLLGREAAAAVFIHPELLNIPIILETPAMKELELAKGEVAKLRNFLESA